MTRMRLLVLVFAMGLLLPRMWGQVGVVQEVDSRVYFRQGEFEHKGRCNNAWITFEDYVVVIDANFPSDAEEVLPEIRRAMSKPVRFVFDTHHLGDHVYGNIILGFERRGPGGAGKRACRDY